MRNLDIVDTRDKLLVYTKTGLIATAADTGVPLLSPPGADHPADEPTTKDRPKGEAEPR
jgi:hypothetical protein